MVYPGNVYPDGKVVYRNADMRDMTSTYYLNQIDNWRQTYNLCIEKLQFYITREQFESGTPRIEPGDGSNFSLETLRLRFVID